MKKRKKLTEVQVTSISMMIGLAIIFTLGYFSLKPELDASRKASDEIEIIKSHYDKKDEVIDYIKRAASTGVGYDYKAYFPSGEIEYIQFDGKNVNVILNVEIKEEVE